MSYILDALNKSEQEKQRKRAAPGLDALHRRSPARGRRLWPLLSLLAFALVLLNGALLYWWIAAERPAATAGAPPQSETTTPPPARPSPAPPMGDTASSAIDSRPAAEGELITPQRTRRPDPARSSGSGANARPAVPIAELPANVQRQLPDLRFSSHIYANAPDLRMVNINGRSLREGESVGDGIRLVEITEEGVVLRYQDYRFEVSVLRDWSAG